MYSILSPSIQLLDDDPFILILLKGMLLKQGVQRIETNVDTEEVLHQVATETFMPEIIFLDLHMPKIDGLAVIRELALINYRGHIALMSGDNDTVLRAAAKLANAHNIKVLGYLKKPIKPQHLSVILQRWRSEPFTAEQERALLRDSYSSEDLKTAIMRGEITNYYQPKVRLSTGEVCGLEALARWQHPTKGLISPSVFIPLAEQYGLIDQLTQQVVENALMEMKRWEVLGAHWGPVAINISMDSLRSADLIEKIFRQIGTSSITPEQLSFEVTESRLIEDTCNALEILTRLRLHNFNVSLDDFGTGYATFSQLIDFPFTELKIDQRFVHGASHDREVKHFYNVSLRLANDFYLSVVAEGVEDRSDWDFVQASGDVLAQGFFIARPMPAAALNDWHLEWCKRLKSEHLIALSGDKDESR